VAASKKALVTLLCSRSSLGGDAGSRVSRAF
jgi:hypothetical protein